jgi:superfamily II DNA helicase RecQ
MADGLAEAIPRGSLVDVRLKATLDADNRRRIAARLKNMSRTAYSQLDGVEAYANLKTCRREHLLRYFGDTEEVAPCDGCDVCRGEMTQSVPEPAVIPDVTNGRESVGQREGIDDALFERLRSWRGDQARSQKVPAYVVLHNSHIEEISSRKPHTIHELGSIKGIGLRRAARYGEEILALVHGESISNDGDEPAYREHLEAADRLLRAGRGAGAVPELARALELGGEAAKKEVDELLGTVERS